MMAPRIALVVPSRRRRKVKHEVILRDQCRNHQHDKDEDQQCGFVQFVGAMAHRAMGSRSRRRHFGVSRRVSRQGLRIQPL